MICYAYNKCLPLSNDLFTNVSITEQGDVNEQITHEPVKGTTKKSITTENPGNSLDYIVNIILCIK